MSEEIERVRFKKDDIVVLFRKPEKPHWSWKPHLWNFRGSPLKISNIYSEEKDPLAVFYDLHMCSVYIPINCLRLAEEREIALWDKYDKKELVYAAHGMNIYDMQFHLGRSSQASYVYSTRNAFCCGVGELGAFNCRSPEDAKKLVKAAVDYNIGSRRGVLRATLVNDSMGKLIKPVLLEAGFKIYNSFKNPNSSNVVYEYEYRVSEEDTNKFFAELAEEQQESEDEEGTLEG